MKLIVTPDYGGLSDITHFNYPIKDLLSQSLKNFRLPVWTDQVGNGFPLGAEGQIGIFSPLNWIVFGIFPMPLAFMLAYMAAFLIMVVGAYLLARSSGLKRPAAIISSGFCAVSGYFIVQLVHLNLYQSFSFIPWAILFSRKLGGVDWKNGILWLAFVFSQMIFVGYPQTFFYSTIILAAYLIVLYNKQVSGVVIKLGIASTLAVFLSAVQVLPLVELVAQSDTIKAAGRQRFIHQMTPKHLLLAINPFLFGDPSRGTYPQTDQYGSRFVENLFYPGIIPLISFFLLLTIIVRRKLGNYRREVVGLLVIFVLSLLLSLGRFTHLKILFKLPPFSFTRIESRFLVFSSISFGILAGFGTNFLTRQDKWKTMQAISLLIFGVHLLQMVWTFRYYHLFSNSEIWLKKPTMAKRLPADARLVSFNQEAAWDRVLPERGWYGKEFLARDGLNSLGPNLNMVFGVRQLGVYAQQLPKRQEMIQRNMFDSGTLGENIRDVFGVTHITDVEGGDFKIIENPTALPDIRIDQNIIKVRDIGEALGVMNQSSFNPQTDVLWESETLPRADEEIVVINRSYYPGWKMYYNQSGRGRYHTKIYPVNINQQAVIVPKNSDISTLAFKYDPWTYKVGGIVSLFSLGVWILLWKKFRYNSYYAHRD